MYFLCHLQIRITVIFHHNVCCCLKYNWYICQSFPTEIKFIYDTSKSWQTASLICRSKPNKKNNEETKNKQPRCSEETVQYKVRGVSPEARKGVYGKKDLWKRHALSHKWKREGVMDGDSDELTEWGAATGRTETELSLIHISEPTRPY